MHDNRDTQITQCETQKNCVAKMSRIMLVQQKKLQSFVIYNLCTVMSSIMLTAPRGSVGFWHLSTIIKKENCINALSWNVKPKWVILTAIFSPGVAEIRQTQWYWAQYRSVYKMQSFTTKAHEMLYRLRNRNAIHVAWI